MEDLMNEISVPKQAPSIITVIGVGGAGGNALNHMWKMGIKDVNFLACNTDAKALNNLDIPDNCKIVMGPGLGAGNDPSRGRELAMEAIDEVEQYLVAHNTKMVFIAAGMGGGTGTGASPVIAKLANKMGLLTVAIVTSPLLMEGPMRFEQAARGIEELREYADSLLVINNDSIRDMYGKLPVTKAFGKADDILAAATKAIAELITVETSYMRVDFADLERVMRGSGRAHMGVASAEGEGRALEAARRSLCSPLLNSNLISGAKKILLNISAANVDDISYDEALEVLNYIQSYASCKDENGYEHRADIIWGLSNKPLNEGQMEVVVVATGFNEDNSAIQHKPFVVNPIPNVEIFPEDDEPVFEPSVDPLSPKSADSLPPKPAAAPEPRIVPRESNVPAVLERKPSKYANIEAELRIPSYKRRNMEFVVQSGGAHRRKQELHEEEESTTTTTMADNDPKLFG